METLPIEMLEMIIQLLTPQDLARCSAVCRKWHDVFNQDWMWKPHCDPELEEPLRTIPCVATPAFVAPEAENSTLSPNCYWKLAFIRETHLWKNWRNNSYSMDCNKDNFIEIKNRDPINVDFFTDTLVVVCYSNSIEIFDASVRPSVLVAETNTSVGLNKYSDCFCSVIGTTVLLVQTYDLIRVFNVDITNHLVELKHNISLDYSGLEHNRKENFYLCRNRKELTFKILDLTTNEILKEVACPVKEPCQYDVMDIWHMITISKTSDFVAVAYPTKYKTRGYYVYDLKQQTFLPGPVVEGDFIGCEEVVHDRWLAIFHKYDTVEVYNIDTGEVLLTHNLYTKGIYLASATIDVCKDGFIFFVRYEVGDGEGEPVILVGAFFPSLGTWTAIGEVADVNGFDIVNKKYIVVYDSPEYVESMWKLSDKIVRKLDIPFTTNIDCKINQSFTKALKTDCSRHPGKGLSWYVRHLW